MSVEKFIIRQSDGAVLPYHEWTARKPGFKVCLGDPRKVKVVKPVKVNPADLEPKPVSTQREPEVVIPDENGVVRAGPPEIGDIDMLDLRDETVLDLTSMELPVVKPLPDVVPTVENSMEAEYASKTRNELKDIASAKFGYAMPPNAKHREMVDQLLELEREAARKK